MKVNRRDFVQGVGSLAALHALGLASAARAQSGIETARVLVGFSPGGTTDNVSRRIAEGLRAGYAKTGVVENRAGAGGRLAIEQMRIAPADGSTLLLTPASMITIYPHIYKKLSYDPLVDLQAVSTACQTAFGLGVGPAVPATVRTVQEFIAWCKANRTEANYGSPAAGSVPHFLGVLLGRAGGFEFQHVAFRGSQPALIDMMGGQLPAVSAPVGEFLPHLGTGKVRMLATSGAARSTFMPDVPTYTEQGFKELEYAEWFGIFLPGKAAPDAVQRLASAIQSVVKTPEYLAGIAQMGLDPVSSSPAEFDKMIRSGIDEWRPIVKEIGFTAES